MKKKKNTFTLIEVIIAIAITTTACFFLLQFEESYIKNARQSLLKVKKERLIQEAYVVLLEHLYTNRIDWKTIEDQKTYRFALSDKDWEAEASFSPVKHTAKKQILGRFLDVRAHLTLQHLDDEFVQEEPMHVCVQKHEGGLHVQAPEA